jgi:iron-only hydrogenase group A
LQSLAEELGVRDRRYAGEKRVSHVDLSSESIVHDPAKCILCGKCVRICEEIQGVSAIDFVRRGSNTRVAPAFDLGMNSSTCINCGQCILSCPTGALREQSHLKEVLDALADDKKFVVVQHAPSISVTLGEMFGMKPGVDICGLMTAALRQAGFKRVFDTAFSADLTTMEEASELVHRVRNGGKLPLLTSCSPGWVKFVEQFYPDFLDNLSTCKSPQQMMGALIKTYYAEREGIDPDRIFSVSIVPCTASKFEARQPGMSQNGRFDIDAVLTTREASRLIHVLGVDMNSLVPGAADSPFGRRSTAGKMFGATGGVMEAVLRTAHYLTSGKDMENLVLTPVRGLDGVKKARLRINNQDIGVAAVSGLGNARKLLEEIRAGWQDLLFVEVMTCPGGCIAGGGQPYGTSIDLVRSRMQALYKIDRDETVRTSHANEDVNRLYEEFLGAPLGERSHHLLHTHYAKREAVH